MADTFGLKIGLEGEKEFKKALADINQSFKVLGSEMKLVESQFSKSDDSAEALAARHKVLAEQVEAQKKKVEMLRQAMQNAAETFGENDRRTQAWQIQLNNAQAALNGMERELADNEEAMDKLGKEMDDTGDSADEMADDLDDAADAAEDSEGKFSKLGSVLKGVGVAMGAVVTAAAAAAVSLGKAVVEAYGEYEQLVGGIDTLFKDSSAAMQEYANNAYKTAGMSANDYMSTVTSFSASLISSLGGDTEAAVKYADMAITDMADNANKMGTDIGLIQNAYQGFAKQNYTMLDNLKLGYGGTKTEMERLLADAQAISGIEYDISSYADVVSAIHVIQESMGVAGATAAEAEHTIEGSMNAMKAAVSNLVVGFGNADADIEQLCNNVVDAFQDVLTNITPVIENIISALPTALNALLETVVELLPTLLETVVDLFSQVLNTLLTLLPQLIPVVIEAVLTIVNTVIENLPLLVEAAIQIVMSLVQGIASALPTLIPAAIQAIITIVQSLINSLPMILDAALQLITGLADGLLAAIPVLIAALPEIILSIINFILDGAYTNITSSVTQNGTSFSFSNLELCSLDANSSYDFHLYIRDQLSSLSALSLYFTVPQGTPLVALRKKMVGINTPTPDAALHVVGDGHIVGDVRIEGTLTPDQIDYDFGNPPFYYGTCATAAATVAKVVTCSGFVLETGATIAVKFTYYNSGASPTLNVNGTGAIAIKQYGSTAASTYMWRSGEVVLFVYNGSYWELISKSTATTTYYGLTKLSSSVTSTSTTVAANAYAVKLAYDRQDFEEITLETALALSYGGTGATTAAAARTNLGITSPYSVVVVVKEGSYTSLYQLVMVSALTVASPSVTSAFQGCVPLASGLFRRRMVPSMVGVEKVMLSPLVARAVAGMPNLTRYSQK
ncbi:MAG: hypothetical protein E7457_00010 [Ruminococcaceae bacterium]|nr:hypothetical protein [Oscillospiraceae bacterium]